MKEIAILLLLFAVLLLMVFSAVASFAGGVGM